MNYMLRGISQLAHEELGVEPENRKALEELGDKMEQKLTISAKKTNVSGVSSAVLTPTSGAADMLTAIQKLDFDQAIQVMKEHYPEGPDGVRDAPISEKTLQNAKQAMIKVREALEKATGGKIHDNAGIYGIASYFPEIQAGPSKGINLNRLNLPQAIGRIFGGTTGIAAARNDHLDMLRYLVEFGERQYNIPEREEIPAETKPYQASYEEKKFKNVKAENKKTTNTSNSFAKTNVEGLDNAPERGVMSEGRFGKEAASDFIEGVSKNKKALLFGGLGVLGLGAMISMGSPGGGRQTPIMPQSNTYQQGPESVFGDIGGVDFNVDFGSRGNVSNERISQVIESALVGSGYQGRADVRINHTNNAKKLDRTFYRDTVNEYL
jgi:hypothetical protein